MDPQECEHDVGRPEEQPPTECNIQEPIPHSEPIADAGTPYCTEGLTGQEYLPEQQFGDPPSPGFPPMNDPALLLPHPPTDGGAPQDCIVMDMGAPQPPSLPYCNESPSPHAAQWPATELPWNVQDPASMSCPLPGQACDQQQMHGFPFMPSHAYDQHQMHGPSSMPLPGYNQHQMHGPSSMPLPEYIQHQMHGPSSMPLPEYNQHQMYGPSATPRAGHVQQQVYGQSPMPPHPHGQNHMYGPAPAQPGIYDHHHMHGPPPMPHHMPGPSLMPHQMHGPPPVPNQAYVQARTASAVPVHPQAYGQMGVPQPPHQLTPPQGTHHDPDMHCEVENVAQPSRSRTRLKKPSSYVPIALMLILSIVWVVIIVLGTDSNLRVILPVLLCLLYLAVYTPEWVRSSTRKFLCNQQQESNLFHYVEELRLKKPSLTFHVTCWHHEKRARQVTHTDGNGNSHTETKWENVKVVSHTRKEEYAFTKWADATASLPVLDSCDLTKLYLTKNYGFMDEAATQKYNRALQDFKRRTPADKNMDFSTILTVNGFQEHTLCHLGGGSPCWVSFGCYMLASVFCCSLPYRMALDHKVAAHEHNIRKLIGE